MEEKLEGFLKIGFGDGDYYGCGSGCGYGRGSGCGFGCGSGSGAGNDLDFRSGSGCGCGSGRGYGCGSGSGIKKITGKHVVKIDGLQTVVCNIKNGVLSGYILNDDLTTVKCYVVKGNGYFAHGKSIKEARKSLAEKYMEDMGEEEVFEKFMSEFEPDKKYKGTLFFDWHHYITGSCLMGRKSFVKNHGLNLDDEFTVEEFFDICRNDYGSEVIERLEERWKKSLKI